MKKNHLHPFALIQPFIVPTIWEFVLFLFFFIFLLKSLFLPPNLFSSPMEHKSVRIGSKTFPESYLLGEIYAQLLESRGIPVTRRFGLGGTMICNQALLTGEIDLYVEYSGTMDRIILKNKQSSRSFPEINAILKKDYPYLFLDPPGFNNTYALAISQKVAEEKSIKTISDLAQHPDVRIGWNPEFLNREDGAIMLKRVYGLDPDPIVMNHSLLYKAIESKQIDLLNAFSTDGELIRYNLILLEDDKQGFPSYLAAPLVRKDLPADTRKILNALAGRITDEQMRTMNYTVSVETSGARVSFEDAARIFLLKENLLHSKDRIRTGTDSAAAPIPKTKTNELLELALHILFLSMVHISLTAVAVGGAVVFAVPFAVLIYRRPSVAGPVLYVAGLFQTIPSIALLALMIPLFGIGVFPAIVALFVYALLPILRNTYSSLQSIDPVLRDVSTAMGLFPIQRLVFIELPLALPGIMAGVRTATIINIGTATLAAFIGGGGLGEPIVTGLSLNDTGLILQGAIPAAILAILVEVLFELGEKKLLPAHLRKK